VKSGEWRIVEPKMTNWYPQLSVNVDESPFGFDGDPWYRSRHDKPEFSAKNKTVIVWPDEGEGLLFGLVRRGVGRSMSQSGGYDSWTGEYDYDPGGFAAEGFVALYAIKTSLSGVDYLLVPHWACSLAHGKLGGET